MRIIVVTAVTLFFGFMSFWAVKYWGLSQTFTEYRHPMLQTEQIPVEFVRPTFANLDRDIASAPNLFLDLSVTFDQKLVIPRRTWASTEKPIRLHNYDEIKSDLILLTDVAEKLKGKKLILNIIENAAAVHENFMAGMKELGLEKGENFIVTSPYEAPLKALKEIAPALVYGTTQPEILKIMAMQSMHLLEAANLRADVIIHPLKIRGHDFFTGELVAEIKRRHRKMIIGPVNPEELDAARKLEPMGIILTD